MESEKAEVIEWADPPPRKRGQVSIHTPELLAELRAHPGEWALIQKAVKISATSNQFCKRNPEYESVARVIRQDGDGGKSRIQDVYMRYVGK